MKIRNSSRITALVLALVMLLPLISIPTFAEVDPSKILYSEDFTSYEGLAGDALLARLKSNWEASTAKNAQVVTENGNTYMRFPMESMIPAGSEFEAEIYLYDGYTKWNNTEGCKQYTPSSYNAETGELTFTQEGGDPLTLALDTSNAAEGIYGKLTYGGHTWLVTTGEYAACQKFGDGYAVDKYSHIYFGECELYTEADPEVAAGTKKVGDIKNYPAGISYEDHDKVVVKYKLFIEEGSSGIHNMQLNRFDNASTKGGNFDQNFVELGNLELSTGYWEGGSLTGATLPIGEWVEISYIVDLKNGTIQGVLDGEAKGIVTIGAKATGGIILSGWTLTKIFKQSSANLAGGLLVDDVVVLTGDQAGGLVKFKSYVNDFEGTNVGDNIPGLSGVDASYKIADLGDEHGKVWALGNSAEGTGAQDKNATLKTSLFTADMDDFFTLSADYYIPEGTGNQFQTQFISVNGISAGATVTKNWGDIYCIRSKDGVATIGRETNPTAYILPYDTWFNVTVEFQMSNNTYDIYVDGSIALAGQKVAAGGINFDALAGVNPNTIIMGKQNKSAASYLKGTMYLDNIVMAAGEFEGAFGADDVWTDVDDLYADAMTVIADPEWQDEDYDPHAELADWNLFVEGHAYSFPSTLIFTDADADWTPDGIQLNIASDIVVTEDNPETEVDEYKETEMAIDKMVRPMHVGISAKKASMAVLSANYTVSEDAKGRIESELFDDAWVHLFTINADASVIESAAFTKGKTFNITIVMDFATGTAYVYYNNLLINVVEHAKIANGLNAGEWSVAKIMKGSEVYAGNVVVTDMTITGALTEAEADSPLYLYESGEKATNIIETVDAASIRLKDPTGLRFATQINTAALLAVADEVGMIIAPKAYVDAAGGVFTTEALDQLGYVTNYLKIEAGAYYDNENSTAVLPTSNHKYITASIVNILDTNISREFAAIGYYVIDGVTYYADSYTVRSVRDIADAAIASGEYADVAETMAVLNKYATPADAE